MVAPVTTDRASADRGPRSLGSMTSSLRQAVESALATVNDPEIHRPITELEMVADLVVDAAGDVGVTVLLTVSGCPMKDTLTRDVQNAVRAVPGVRDVRVTLGVMSDEQRAALQTRLRGGQPSKEVPFARPDSLTQVFAIASGKGGVGKSSVTVNLALAMARHGRRVGLLDADVYGHSVPAMLGVADERPTQVQDMIMPVVAQGLSVISIGMLKPRREQVVAWRGPMLDRALVQMLTDVYWGDIDVLLLDLPPGTGDMAISVGQHLPNAEVVVVTTPQAAASEVAERAGTMASMMHQKVRGVIENMSWLPCPHCGPTHRIEVFGSGGGDVVAATLSSRLGYDVPVLARVPIDLALRAGGDRGTPIVAADPEAPSAVALADLADVLTASGRGLAGRRLGLTPAGR
jgi:ATP-binding protein involved in chromosome partitioning